MKFPLSFSFSPCLHYLFNAPLPLSFCLSLSSFFPPSLAEQNPKFAWHYHKMISFYCVLSFLLFCTHIIAQYVDNNLFVEELYRFPNGTHVENILVLKNGSLLLTLSTEPSLYLLDPESPGAPVLVQHFPHKTSLLGIAQLNPSTVAVIAGNLTGSLYEDNAGVPGSFSVFLLALSGQVVASIPVPQASLLQGMTSPPDDPIYLLLSDPTLGTVWQLDTLTGRVEDLYPGPGLPEDIHFFAKSPEDEGPSINGIQSIVYDLYLTNTHTGLLGKNFVTPDGRPAMAYPTPDTRPLNFTHCRYGDFAICPDLSLWIPDVIGNTVNHVRTIGNSAIRTGDWDAPTTNTVVLNGGILDHPTAVTFQNSRVRCEVMYVVTAGFLPGYGGTGGGQVLRVDLILAGEALTPIGYIAQENVDIEDTPPEERWSAWDHPWQ